ncbi:MAG: carbon monoxide dehydrogenase subunit G [Desulfobacterota bacterium]|nr:carbon monoxide dehydrogenase subunit G [Thermodesulfobacteriota bacterium]MDW8001205.1 carbon monoxide dehydrogenase subunit G [Deltaproteobacteria bacterium]
MVIEGEFRLKADIEKLFDFLLKPETILTCLPGAESVKLIGENTYECVVKQKVGPISAKLKFISRLTRVERPNHIELEGEGEDITKLGHFRQKSVVDLKDLGNGEVEITYKTDVQIVGKLAMFGDRIMRAKAKDVEKEFTKNLQEKLKALA